MMTREQMAALGHVLTTVVVRGAGRRPLQCKRCGARAYRDAVVDGLFSPAALMTRRCVGAR
jgi:hypothetical protein